MKRSFLILLHLILFAGFAHSQIIQSSCDTSTEFYDYYFYHAEKCNINVQLIQERSYEDSIVLDPLMTDSILSFLFAVRNSGIDEYAIIEKFEENDPDRLYYEVLNFTGDTGMAWVKHLDSFGFPSGLSKLDSIVTKHNGVLDTIFENPYQPVYNFSVRFPNRMNSNAMALFAHRNIAALGHVSVKGTYISGRKSCQKVVTMQGNYATIKYALNWGNNRQYYRYYEFNVYHDCKVEFISEWGDVLSVSSLPEPIALKAYPNPTHQLLNLEVAAGNYNFRINDNLGRLIYSGQLHRHNQITVADLKPGMYFLHLSNPENAYVTRFIKQ